MNRTPKHIALTLLADLLLAALILGAAAGAQLFPALRRSPAAAPEPTVTAAPEPVPEPSPTPEPVSEPEPTATPDLRTPWQIRFADQFTEETMITENSYTSPQVAIHISTIQTGEGAKTVTYHVADIHIASLDNFRTRTAHGTMEYFDTQDLMEMDAESHAILAISGDFMLYQDRGFLVRNGEIYHQDQTWWDLCVLFEDGVMETYRRDEYSVDELLERGVAQAWNFGPALLDREGHAMDSYETSAAVGYPNPRSAIGYYEPGHYCFVLVDGRQEGYSRGMLLPELAKVFEELGCQRAYNLDGGGSAVMTFLHERFSRQSNGADRPLGDLLLITEEGWEDRR